MINMTGFVSLEPKKVKFLLEDSKSMDLVRMGRCENRSYIFITCEDYHTGKIIDDYSLKLIPLPVKIIDDNFVAETEDLIIIDFIKVSVYDLKTE